jgi:signal transduction histidine kinase
VTLSVEVDALRTAELTRLDALDSGGDRDLQALVELTAQVAGVSKVAINLISADAQHQVAAYGFDPGICARADSMCAAVLPEPRPVIVPDAREDERFKMNPFVTGEIGQVRFYASAPLVTRRGIHIGRLCAFDDVPHETLTSPETLAVLADRVVDILELRMRSRELEQSVADLSQARSELTRANARLATFAEQVSHDLRNPLSALLASVELLQSEPALADDPTLDELVGGARRSGERMNALIERILDQARSSAGSGAGPGVAAEAGLGAGPGAGWGPGSGSARTARVGLAEEMDQVRSDLAVLLADDAVVEVREDAELDVDPTLLHLVLLNLVANAVKFSRTVAPPRVTVAASLVGERCRIEVADNGPGIPVEQRSVVWEPYVRLRPDVDGTGIGLAAVRSMVEDAGGSVGLGEGPAGGLLVWVELPA